MLLLNLVVSAVQHPSIVFYTPTPGSVIALFVALFGLFLSAFNSGAEIAFFSLKKTQIDDIDDEPLRERIAELAQGSRSGCSPPSSLATIW